MCGTLVLIDNVTERNAQNTAAVYAGSHYLKSTAAVSHTGPSGDAGKNKTPKRDTGLA